MKMTEKKEKNNFLAKPNVIKESEKPKLNPIRVLANPPYKPYINRWDNGKVDVKKEMIAAWSPMTSITENYPNPAILKPGDLVSVKPEQILDKSISEQIDDSFKEWKNNEKEGIGKKDEIINLNKEIDKLEKEFDEWKPKIKKSISKIFSKPLEPKCKPKIVQG
jgi:hypothetical protein